MQYYKLATSSIGWLPRVNVLLPDGYDTSRRYPVLFLLHGGGENYSTFDTKYDIRNHTAGRDLIVVMPDGGKAGWYSDPESSNVGPRNWETFHVDELIPWVDATFSTIAQPAGRAVSGFSMGGFGALKYAAKYPELFASVSSHSGPADLRIQDGAVVHWANFTAGATDLKGGTIYGIPWDQVRVSADNPVEHVESYRGKRVFLVCGTDSDRYESIVLPSQRSFEKALDGAGIGYERYEDTGTHIVRWGRVQQDIDSMLNFLTKAG